MKGIGKQQFYSSYTIGFFMAIIAGFSDVFGFIALDRLFTAHITGNIVIILSSLIYNMRGIAPKLIAIPLFMLFASLISAVIEHHGHTKKMLQFWLFLEIVLFLGLMAAGLTILPKLDVGSGLYILFAMLPVSAMAIHNTLLRTYMAKLPPCTAMTGNLTQFMVLLTALCLSKLPGKLTPLENSMYGVKRFGNVLVGFTLGGLASALGFVVLGFYCLVAIVLLLLALLIHLQYAKSD